MLGGVAVYYTVELLQKQENFHMKKVPLYIKPVGQHFGVGAYGSYCHLFYCLTGY